ncbi:MAG: hypothetical protein HW416_1230 [Chloroflexi bacterium]|nr:hypothetical protein [Chloroflexota bacterium]
MANRSATTEGNLGNPDRLTSGLDVRRSVLSESLLDLAYDVSSYLRKNKQPIIRLSAALLLAASLSACGDEDAAVNDDEPAQVEAVAPLTTEIRAGLPTRPGQYPIVENTVRRDGRGVYYFSWREPAETSGPGHQATVSLLRLAEAGSNYLEVRDQGDPVLHLRSNTPVELSAQDLTGTGHVSSGLGGPGFVFWHPFYVMGPTYGPGYYSPPTRVITSSGAIQGSTVSTTPPAASDRVVGASRAVSGRAGGTGAGTAASQRAGVSTDSGGKSGVAAPKSGGFSSSSASVGAATAKGSSSS